jgi:amino acid adenylation domain-containing protein
MRPFIFEMLSEYAQNSPENEALVCGEKRLTYADTDRISDQIANYLYSIGIKKGDRVGISMRKCVEYICCLFGIMKSGACYVPIDHEFPLQRKMQIIKDCDIQILICDNNITDCVVADRAVFSEIKHMLFLGNGETLKAENIEIQQFEALAAGEQSFKVPVDICDNDLIYVMYTSGSTGKPKGVMVTHGNIKVFVDWCVDKLQIEPQDRILNTAPFTFDLSGLDIFNSFHSGATMIIVEDQRMINMVFYTISQEQVTFVSTVPTLIGAMVQTPQIFKRYNLESVRTFITGAALCPPIFMMKLHEHLPKAKLYNLYGPTEAAIYCLYHEIDPKNLDKDTPLPIGIPFENTEAYIIDHNGNEAVKGEPGEIVLRGSHVSPGYFGNEKQTKMAFRPFTLLPHLNENVYYTGDIGRQDEKGLFYFLGRKDDLIKSRGFRIELNEIEIALSGLDDKLHEFAAVAIPDPINENLIYAAVVPKNSIRISEDEIINHCVLKIPSYMVPEKVVFFKSLPKTSSGKISRKEIVKKLIQSN